MSGALCCVCCWQGIVGLLALALICTKVYLKWTTGRCKTNKKLIGKTVIVTGANTGIGKETAKDMARRGARVILGCRDADRGNAAKEEIISETGNKQVLVRHLDLSSLASVRKFANQILTSESHLDILINNAGAGGIGSTVTEDGLLMGMQINHFGPFLLTNLLVDLMKKSSPSRIIFVSSLGHKYAKFDVDNLNFEKNFSDINVYSCSKLANVLTANELARKLKGSGVTVNSLHPGAVNTDIFRRMPQWAMRLTKFLLDQMCKSPEEGAQTSIYLAVSKKVNGVTGKYFSDCKEVEPSPLAHDEGLAKKLWEKSEEFVKLRQTKSKKK